MMEQLVFLFSSLRRILDNYVFEVLSIVKDLDLTENPSKEAFFSLTCILKTSSFYLRYPSQQREKLLR